MKAWQTGAKEWRENAAKEQAGFHSMHESWKVYEPVGFSGTAGAISMPSMDKIVSAYLEEVIRFIDREIYPQAAKRLSQWAQMPLAVMKHHLPGNHPYGSRNTVRD